MKKICLGLVEGWLLGIVFVTKVMAANDAILELVPDSLMLTPQTSKIVGISLDPWKNEMVGVDIVLKYNPEMIEISEVNKTEAFSAISTVVTRPEGVISFAVYNGAGSYLTTKQQIVTMKILAKEVGTSMVSFVFTPSQSRDTNVVNKTGVDVLGRVNALTINITNNLTLTSSPSLVIPPLLTTDNSSVSSVASSPSVLGAKDIPLESPITKTDLISEAKNLVVPTKSTNNNLPMWLGWSLLVGIGIGWILKTMKGINLRYH